MRLARSYKVLRRTAQARLSRLRTLGVSAATVDAPTANRLLAYVAIEALNTWGLFVRYYVLSFGLRPVRCAGGRVRIGRPGVSGPPDVLSVAMARLKPKITPLASGG